ncbi:glycosyltransferase family 2 protein [Propioniciclava sp.]|uniref:glycosyltransferase family 2 protein n=1 Tax=Propioniciclava sp. TaxID=2038686 RepID=UPI002630F4CD|nr:glycosyltransferase family 2 protein [Propioniciclava sp.]
MRSDVAVVIPVHNEEQVVEQVVRAVRAEYENVICVNDGSTDGSAAAVARTGAFLINHPINMGQGAALQTGIEFVRTLPGIRYVVTFDADGQHRLVDVARMLAEIEASGVDVVLGSRFLDEQPSAMPTAKRWVLKLAIAFSNLVSGLRLTDTHNGLRVFTRRVADALQITMPDMAHASEIVDIIATHHYSYREVPVQIAYTEYSLAKGQSITNAVNIAFDTLLRKVSR